ncbi:hypothetical protein CHU32_26085 [Superficieibacter electus]|uniref:Uncharacterized protein n=1 Tax=Superficieibacter electus TaxID=2022662 RepID=A0A2P5GHB8_9ENTR|nr:hypothetical protein CHU33_26170 [Superficieibacter electus]POP41814.1 hypothetical protein CHU32_26085 [Superficieibacter electus]
MTGLLPAFSNARFYNDKWPELEQDVRFYFETFGFLVEAQITEHVSPTAGEPGRVLWLFSSQTSRISSWFDVLTFTLRMLYT